MKRCGKHTWREISKYTGVEKNTCKSRYTRKGHTLQPGPCPVCSESRELGIKSEVRGNELYITATTDRIMTEADLIAAVGLDQDEWVVVSSEYNKWDGFAKLKEGDLHWRNGKLDHGDLEYGGIGIVELFGVRLKCVRKEPVLLCPSLSAVEVVRSGVLPPAASSKAPMAIAFADLHLGYERDIYSGALRPFHDRNFISAVVKLIQLVGPREVHLLGDGIDLTGLSTFLKSPEHAYTLQPTLMEFAYILAMIRDAMPRDSDFYYHEGNHEARMGRELKRAMPELYGIKAANVDIPALSLGALLDLNGLSIKWVGDYPNGFRKLGDMVLKHGDVAKQPGLTAKHYVENEYSSTLTAHIHRPESAMRVKSGADGEREVVAHVIGCGCRLDGMVPPGKENAHWGQSMAVIHYGADWSSAQNISVVDGRFSYAGERYTCDSYVGQLERDIPSFRWR